jgi:hypothetical protein
VTADVAIRLAPRVEDPECPACGALAWTATGRSGGMTPEGEWMLVTWWKGTCGRCGTRVERHLLGVEDLVDEDGVAHPVVPMVFTVTEEVERC